MENNDGYGSEVTYFQEVDQAMDLIHESISSKPLAFDHCFVSLTKILSKYQEQSQLLGPHLSRLMEPLNSSLVLCVCNYNQVFYSDGIIFLL